MISFQKVNKLPPLTEVELQQYLSSGLFRGIGKKTAQTLVAHFGCDTLEVLDSSPERLEQISGMAEYRIATITKAWSESKANPNQAVIALLLGMGTPLGLTLKICDHYGPHASEVLINDPYRLIDELDGIGFKTADQLALSLGISPTSETRYEKGIIHVLKDALSEGHCFLPESELLGRAISLLERPNHTLDYKSLSKVIGRLVEKQTLAYGSDCESVYLKAAYRTEPG